VAAVADPELMGDLAVGEEEAEGAIPPDQEVLVAAVERGADLFQRLLRHGPGELEGAGSAEMRRQAALPR